MIRYPAEWENQQRIWLSWPHNRENWAHRPAIVDFYVELVGIIRRFQTAALLVPSEIVPTLPAALRREAAYPLELFEISTDDIWIRDYGPLFVEKDDQLHAVSFGFNAWGEKFPPWDTDNQVPARIADALGISHVAESLIFEGGAIEINGYGAGMTTRDCLVGPNRNPDTDLPEIETAIKEALGLSSLLVLPGGLAGDHTDGHIDNVARFVAPDRIVLAREDDPSSPNHEMLRDAHLRISAWRPGGMPLTIRTLPLPFQRTLGDEILPASYMNFIYVNGGLIVPLYRSVHDDEALSYFKQAYPDRTVIGIDCTLVIEEGGSLHCLSKQEPMLEAF